MYNEQASQQLAIQDWILTSNAAAASYNSVNGIDLSKFKRALYVLNIGVLNTSGTVDARLQSSPNANFSPAHNITNTNLVQVTNSAGNTNVFLKMEVRAEYVQQQNSGDRYVRLNTTIGTTTVNYGAIGFGCESEQKPGNQYENTSVVVQTVVD